MNKPKIIALLLAVIFDAIINKYIYYFIPWNIFFPFSIWIIALVYFYTEYTDSVKITSEDFYEIQK